jgi:hypothetical protein
MPFKPIPKLLAALLSLICLAAVATPPRLHIDLVTHNSVVIDRPAAAIWPFIVDITAWKSGPHVRHLDGPRDQVGEVFVANMPDSSSKPLFRLENVEFVPGQRRTIKLYGDETGSLIGYASWELQEVAGKTRVTYDVYSQIDLSGEDAKSATPQDLAAKRTQYETANATRFQSELQTLKHLVEAGSSQQATEPSQPSR